ncbi:MAG: hypothetical protein DMD91_16560 [Candidatus Rokuibacteriota bacterium]|nr:MAG: hypothetical protein DMD91_16560 [Candidatus Rokubacteria bacterium]
MNCPSCSQEMSQEKLEAKYGKQIELDICHPCSAFWFDDLVDLALSPDAVLHLFVVINDNRTAQRNPLGTAMACPRCRQRLVVAPDMQRATRFSYWACPREHGHFITLFEFLREKNFVRPLSAPEVAALKQSVRTVTCSSCGAPVNVETDAVCQAGGDRRRGSQARRGQASDRRSRASPAAVSGQGGGGAQLWQREPRVVRLRAVRIFRPRRRRARRRGRSPQEPVLITPRLMERI